jgi:hypothetical protein
VISFLPLRRRSPTFRVGELVSLHDVPLSRGTVIDTREDGALLVNWPDGLDADKIACCEWHTPLDLLSITALQDRYTCVMWFWNTFCFGFLAIALCGFVLVAVKSYSMGMISWYTFISMPWIAWQGAQSAGKLAGRYEQKLERL